MFNSASLIRVINVTITGYFTCAGYAKPNHRLTLDLFIQPVGERLRVRYAHTVATQITNPAAKK